VSNFATLIQYNIVTPNQRNKTGRRNKRNSNGKEVVICTFSKVVGYNINK
jgi:hypothetical protein